MVEIAKALSQDARILVMDEPTATLSDRETELLFAMIDKLKAQGVAIIYISHRLAEVFALGDRITVLRDGRKIASVPTSAKRKCSGGFRRTRLATSVFNHSLFPLPDVPATRM